jgi:hypothetical protein
LAQFAQQAITIITATPNTIERTGIRITISVSGLKIVIVIRKGMRGMIRLKGPVPSGAVIS